jgi:hypothetical protein
VIVDDGSTDGTDAVIEEYRRTRDWIDLVRLPERRDRSFSAKVHAFNVGLDRIKDLDFEVIVLLQKFASNPQLGVAGTPFVEHGVHYDYRFTNIEHVSGACQLFRRACFEAIGGYQPIRGGGIDWVAVTTARMKGWQTRTFTEQTCLHHRPIGTGSARGKLRALYRHGQKDYYLGGHPLWQVFRCAYQTTRAPYVTGGLCLLAGYTMAMLRGAERPVSQELIDFQRAEQMRRLRKALGRRPRAVTS